MGRGIHYKNLLDIATPEEKLFLCKPNIRGMLQAIKSGRHGVGDSLYEELLNENVDISWAIKERESIRTILTLISRHENKELLRGLAKELCVDDMDIDKMLNILDGDQGRKLIKFLKYTKPTGKVSPDNMSRLISPKHGLRYYQLNAARKIGLHLNKTERRVMYHAPTGSGKTRTAMAVVSQHFRNNGPTWVLWLASTAELVDQAFQAFESAWSMHGDVDCMLRSWFRDAPAIDPPSEPIRNTFIVASLQKILAEKRSNSEIMSQLKEKASLIVFDEAHQTVAREYRKIVEKIMENDTCKLLGLSATPGRGEEKGVAELSDMYAGKKITIWHPKNMDPIEYLIAKGYLARPEFHEISIEGDSTIVWADAETDFSSEKLEKLGCDMDRNIKISQIVYEVQKKHKRILVFTPSVDSAHMCSALLRTKYRVKNSSVVSAATPKDSRDHLLDRYKDQFDTNPYVIFNFGVLTAGFDAPSTSAVIIARPTKSVVLYSQMVGRAIRGEKSGGNLQADIYTVVDTSIPEFWDVAAAFQKWNDLWSQL